MASTIQIRVDDDLKNKSDQLFKDLGTDTTSAIRMFLTQAVAYNGFDRRRDASKTGTIQRIFKKGKLPKCR